MGTTSDFVKLRSGADPRPGEWNSNYAAALTKAKAEGKFIVAAWSNGDLCSYCVQAEKCMLTDEFKAWIKGAGAYFVFQYSGDKDKGKTVHDWIYGRGSKISLYPGFRITLYDASGKAVVDRSFDGNALRGKKVNAYGAKEMIKNLEAVFALRPGVKESDGGKKEKAPAEYAVRLNEKLTTAKVNKVLDAIDANDGYCPCQPRGEGTKCHCDDFKSNKGLGEPCVCKIYVKKAKPSAKKAVVKKVGARRPAAKKRK